MADMSVQAFFSYNGTDDRHLDGGIEWLYEELRHDLRILLGERLKISSFVDSAFEHLRDNQPKDAPVDTYLLIAILTPYYFNDPKCRDVANALLQLKKTDHRRALILPIYLIDADVLEDPILRAKDSLAQELSEQRTVDWRDMYLQLRDRHKISNDSQSHLRQRIAEVAQEIKAILERLESDIAPTIPEPGPGVRFRVNEDGLIDRAPDEPHDADENEARLTSLKTGLIEACDRLLGSSGHNALGFVLDTIRAYRGAIDRPLTDIQYTDVWRHGQRLQNLTDAATRDVDRLEPSLEDDQHAALNDLLDLHGPFMLSSTEGRELQAMADRYQATREQQERQKEVAQAFKEAIQDSKGLVTDEVKRVIAEASDELGKGRFPEREAITSETTNRNFLSTAGKAAAYVSDHAAGGIIGGVAAGTVIGSGLVGVSIDALNLAGEASRQFLLTHQMILKGLVASSTDTFAWLNHLLTWLGQRAPAATARPAPEDAPAIGKTDLWTPGRVFRDIDEPWCPEMVVIPAGDFMMGSPEDEKDRMSNEGPQRPVTISRQFVLGRYAVTFEEYDHFCEEIGRDKPGDRGWGRGKRPVINVFWQDAKDYCDWLSEQSGRTYHLPSEAEWEYACRAGSTTAYAFGDDFQKGDANFDHHIGKTSDVGTYAANAFGLCDMHGNVFEWCADHFEDGYAAAPADGRPLLLPDGTYRVVRGGSWRADARGARSAYRSASEPGGRGSDLGFRCAGLQEQS